MAGTGPLTTSQKDADVPPQFDRQAFVRRQEMAAKLSKRDIAFGARFEVNDQRVMFKVFTQTEPDLVVEQIQTDNNLTGTDLSLDLMELIERKKIKSFDWRSLGVVPFVRDQEDKDACWAYAATAAFESSLMIQRLKLGRKKKKNTLEAALSSAEDLLPDPSELVGRRETVQEKVTLNVYCPLHAVKDKQQESIDKADWHEKAFTYFFDHGVPLKCVKIFRETDNIDLDRDDAESRLIPDSVEPSIKTIAWDYVHDGTLPRHEIPPENDLKRKLLEHGPLVVGIAFDEEFRDWGKPKDGVAAPVDTDEVFQGTTSQSVPNHVVLLSGWNDEKEAWIIQNSWGTSWGYQCDGPRVMQNSFRSTDRGFAYVKYRSNDIGKFATFIEADLLTEEEENEMRRFETIARQAVSEPFRNATQVVGQVPAQARETADQFIQNVKETPGMVMRFLGKLRARLAKFRS